MTEECGWFTRERLSTLTLLALTAIALWLSYLIVKPLLPALAWAVAFAVIAGPLHRRLERRLKPNAAAALAVAVVTVTIAGPITFVFHQLGSQLTQLSVQIGGALDTGQWASGVRVNPYLAPLARIIESQIPLEQVLRRISEAIAAAAPSFVVSSLWAVLQIVIALFVLFYLFRDRRYIMGWLRWILPLSRTEADAILERVSDTVYAAVYGQVAVAAVQGALGGLIFAALDIPAAVLWGTIMFVMAVIPFLGAFVVWGPFAIYLAAIGEWTQAIILTVFGTFIIGLIDNILYPILVGNRLRLHTVPVFFAIFGGLLVFGASGIVLGPVVLAVTLVLFDVWHSRTAGGQPAEAAIEKPRAA